MAPFAPFHWERRMAVAVSGGADSTALAYLLSRWGKPEALIVDHGLRSEAAEEAALAASQMARLGVPARVLRLAMTPGRAVSERARVARYDALSDACRQAGLTDLLVGHHAQDQAETVLIRRERGSGPAGLAGMAPVVHRSHVRLLRPLLHATPDRLRATLRQAGLNWSEDPGNEDPARPRGALRQAFGQSGSGQARAALEDADAAALQRHEVEQALVAGLGGAVAFHPEGFAHIALSELSAEALSALVWTVSGRLHPPAPEAVRALLPLRPATLHGAMLRPAGRYGAGWLLMREGPGPEMPALDGAVWDGRWLLRGHPPPGSIMGALGHVAGLNRATGLPAAVLRTLPALRLDGVLLAAPHVGLPTPAACAPYRFTLVPGRPAGGAAFVRGKVQWGCEDRGASPCLT